MSIINENTPIIALRELDLWVTPPAQASIESTVNEEIRSITHLNSGSQYEFLIDIHRNEVMRASETTLTVKGYLLYSKKDGSAMQENDYNAVYFTNNVLHSLFSDCYLVWNDTQLNKNLSTFPYKNYLNTIINSSQNARNTYLKCVGFEDTDLHTLTHKVDVIKNKGKLFEFEGKLDLELFTQQKYLIGGTKLKLVLIKHKPEFSLYTTDASLKASIVFDDIYVNVRKSKINDELLYSLYNALNVSPAKYPVTRNEVKSIVIDKGVNSVNLENIITGQIPNLMYVGFVDNEAYTGAYNKDPFELLNLNISSISTFINGEQFPRRAYKPNFPDNNYTREYLEFLRASKQFNNDVNTIITKKNYKNGFTLFAFDLSQDTSDGYHGSGYANIPRNGIMRLEIQFREQLQKTVNVLLYCQWDNMITISQDMSVSTDY
jgi:hypothetical protein